MGRLSCEPRIAHFSHPHPLVLASVQSQPPMNSTFTVCSCCSLRCDSGYMYTCRTCAAGQLHVGFALHVACAQLPALITHSSHPKHPLSLLRAPPYPGLSTFNCDGCSRPGTAFCYHCRECNFDLHPTCASKPLSISHPSHHHVLNLEFFPPYDIRGFSCDVCGGSGMNHWLYRCSSCEFDAHLDCVTPTGGGPTGQAQSSSQPPQQPQPRPSGPALQPNASYRGPYNNNDVFQPPPQPQPHHVQHQLKHQTSAPATQQNYRSQPPQMAPTQQMYRPQQPANGQQGTNYGLTNMMAQSVVDAAGQQAGQSLVQSLVGGGDNGGGGDEGDSSGFTSGFDIDGGDSEA